MSEDDRRAEPDSGKFEPIDIARRLLREVRVAALATLDGSGGPPFGSLVAVSTEIDGSPILLLSRLARHTRNLAADPRASLLMAEPIGRDPQTAARITLIGRIGPTLDDPAARRRHLARHPDAALWAGFADFAFHRLEVEEIHLVAGFGRAARLPAAAVLLDRTVAAAFAPREAACLAAANRDPARLVRIAARLGPAGDRTTVVGVDPQGLDLAVEAVDGLTLHRIASAEPIDGPERVDDLLDDWERRSAPRDFD